MDGRNLREDAPETFENRFDLHAVFLHLEYSRIDYDFKTEVIYKCFDVPYTVIA